MDTDHARRPTIAPYGTWVSPIGAHDLAGNGHPVEAATFVGDEVWWSEQRPEQGGRSAVRRSGSGGEPVDVLPAPWNARSRVHEYGGASWAVTPDQRLVFTEFSDQRLYVLAPGDKPTPLTAAPPVAAGLRYLEPTIRGDEVWCVRESHEGDRIVRDICAVPLDGTAASEPEGVRSVVSGSDFLGQARVSPDGRRLAWIAWNHPQMPWDGTLLLVADLGADGTCGPPTVLCGSETESVLQPEWVDDHRLYLVSDRTGWWNLYRLDLDDDAGPQPLCEQAADFAGPLWQLGRSFYTTLSDGRLLTNRSVGASTLGILDPADGSLRDVELPGLSMITIEDVVGDRALLRCVGAHAPAGIRIVDLAAGSLVDVRSSVDTLPDMAYLPDARPMTFDGVSGREVHAIVYPPANPDFAAPDGELPPYVAFVHGGPTAHVVPALSLVTAYFTSRGIGVVDVNYGGSSGYGRAYRERLRGEWGVVDVEDTISAIEGVAAAGLADPQRLAIEGGSAGGWTVLSALTRSDVFACGVSYFGVAELTQFARDTHDFESRYLDGLIGPLPEAADLYESRAPLNNADRLSCPVLLLQGLDDPVVPPSQSEMFRDAMVAKGIPHAYLTYEGESHGFRGTEAIVHSRESELSFYGQVMGFAPADVPVVPLWRPEAS